MDDLIADFVAECREMLEALGGEIVAWEAKPDDRARLEIAPGTEIEIARAAIAKVDIPPTGEVDDA